MKFLWRGPGKRRGRKGVTGTSDPSSWPGATIAQLFTLLCALSILDVCRDRAFNAVAAGLNPVRLTMFSISSR